MDSFDGSRRRDPRAAMPPSDPRASRPSEPLEQRLDRWVNTGRQLVEGVSGGRPGARPSNRRPEGRPGSRGGFDSLGRWVEDRLDWLLDDSDDWREPWQESDRRVAEPGGRRPAATPLGAGRPPADWSRAKAVEQPRRRLEAISLRGRSERPDAQRTAAAAPSQAPQEQDWPDDSVFNVPRWQRPATPLRRPDPLQLELERRDQPAPDQAETGPAAARPLPRSSRRR